jgi:hypothetical protein
VPPGGIRCDLASLSPKLSNSTPNAASINGWIERHERTRLLVRPCSFPCSGIPSCATSP